MVEGPKTPAPKQAAKTPRKRVAAKAKTPAKAAAKRAKGGAEPAP
jgi:hypothetical protein